MYSGDILTLSGCKLRKIWCFLFAGVFVFEARNFLSIVGSLHVTLFERSSPYMQQVLPVEIRYRTSGPCS